MSSLVDKYFVAWDETHNKLPIIPLIQSRYSIMTLIRKSYILWIRIICIVSLYITCGRKNIVVARDQALEWNKFYFDILITVETMKEEFDVFPNRFIIRKLAWAEKFFKPLIWNHNKDVGTPLWRRYCFHAWRSDQIMKLRISGFDVLKNVFQKLICSESVFPIFHKLVACNIFTRFLIHC